MIGSVSRLITGVAKRGLSEGYLLNQVARCARRGLALPSQGKYFLHEDFVTGVARTSSGNLVTASFDGTMKCWNVTTGGSLFTINFEEPVQHLLLRGDRILAASPAQVKIVDHIGQSQTFYQKDPVISIECSALEQKLLIGSLDKVSILNTNTGEQTSTIEGHRGGVDVIRIEGNRVITGSEVVISSNLKGELQWSYDASKDPKLPVPKELRRATSIIATLNSVIIGYIDGYIVACDRATGERRVFEQKHNDAISAFVIDPSGRVWSSSTDNTVRGWDVSSRLCKSVLNNEDAMAASLLFKPDRKQLLVGSGDGKIRVWDLASKSLEKCVPLFPHAPILQMNGTWWPSIAACAANAAWVGNLF